MSGDAERPPVWLEGRELRNGKWKKYPDEAGAEEKEGSDEGESNEQEENEVEKMDERGIRSPSCIAR